MPEGEFREPEAFVPEMPWDWQLVEDHDLVKVFTQAWSRAEDMGAEHEDAINSGLMEVFRVLAWEMDSLPMPPDQSDKRTLLIQHVLHRLGEQGNGSK